jgi:hypothetical protein
MGAFGNSALNDLSGFFLKLVRYHQKKIHSDRSERGCRTHTIFTSLLHNVNKFWARRVGVASISNMSLANRRLKSKRLFSRFWLAAE